MHFSQNIDTLILVPLFDNFHDIHDLCYYFFPYILIQFLIFSNSKLPEMVSPFYLFFASVARFYLTCSVCLLPALFFLFYFQSLADEYFLNQCWYYAWARFCQGLLWMHFFLLQSIRVFLYFNMCIKRRRGPVIINYCCWYQHTKWFYTGFSTLFCSNSQ